MNMCSRLHVIARSTHTHNSVINISITHTHHSFTYSSVTHSSFPQSVSHHLLCLFCLSHPIFTPVLCLLEEADMWGYPVLQFPKPYFSEFGAAGKIIQDCGAGGGWVSGSGADGVGWGWLVQRMQATQVAYKQYTHTQRKGGYASQIVYQEISEAAALHLSSARSSCKDKKLP